MMSFKLNIIIQFVLYNNNFSYSGDLSKVPCHCNAAPFFVKMPANEPGDQLDWHCNANADVL